MAATFDSVNVALNGTTPVPVVPDPGSGSTSEVLLVAVHNRDTASRTITARTTGGTINPNQLGSAVIAAGKHGVIPIAGAVVSNGETLELLTDGAAATTEPSAHVSWFNVP